MRFRIKKVLNLPEALEPNTVYLVRIAGGFDIYVTDNEGNTAYLHNPCPPERYTYETVEASYIASILRGDNSATFIASSDFTRQICRPVNVIGYLTVPDGSTRAFMGSGALAPNKKIYVAPHALHGFLIIDTVNNSLTLRGYSGAAYDFAWAGTVLAPTGKLYGIPYTERRIIVINPADDSYSFIDTGDTTPAKWAGGVLAPNGLIYGIPNNSNKFLVINPSNNTVSTITALSGGYNGGVLALNGKIYCIPHAVNRILVIDPSNNTQYHIDGSWTPITDYHWRSAVLGPNGLIYGIPFNDTRIMVVNPYNDTVELIGNVGTMNQSNWWGGCLAPNGLIYCMPSCHRNVLVINPKDNSTSLIGDVGTQTYKLAGAVLGPNGVIYGLPWSLGKVVTITPSYFNWEWSLFYNKS